MRKFYTLFVLGLLSLQVFSQSIPEYCLDNAKVAAYFSTPEYKSNDYTYTYIKDYCYPIPWRWKEYGGVRLDQPLPAKVNLQDALTEPGILYVSENADYSDALIMAVNEGISSIDVYNLIPNRTYNWKVEYQKPGGSATLVETGQFKTTGHVRMLKIDGIYNVRDMGGWIGLGGNPIKYGKLIRGSRLNVNGSAELLITQDGIDELRRLGVLAELDMRDPGDAVNATHSFLGDDIPIRNVQGAYGSRIATFADKPQSIQGIKQIIAWFKEDRPVYFHCSVGADRTGTVAYLIGALCGMSEDALCREFELTSFSADSVPNSRDNGNPEVLIRQRTYVGREDPNDDNESYKFASMVDKIKTFPGGTLQRKVYNHLLEGVNGTKISPEDLSFLVKYLTGYSILGGFNTDVDTLRLELGQTHKINVAPYPVEAEYSSISFKSTSKMIATVSADGLVTAVGGGEAYIIVDVDGIEKYIPVIVPISEESVVCISVSNEYVERYLDEVDYHDDVNYSVSYIERYDTISSSSRKDWPQPARLKWTSLGGVTNQHLFVSETSDFSSCFIDTQLGDKDSTYKFDDLCPGKIYYYKITATVSGKSNVMLMSSAFKVSGVVRMIKLRSAYNVRDLGGWTGLGGHKVKYNVLFRGCRLRDYKVNNSTLIINSEEQIYLTNLGITAELDLRNDDESNSSKSALYRRGGTFKRISNASECQGENILSGDAYISALNYLIDCIKNGKVVYISGVFGAERTGTMAFLINGLLGVDEDGLSKDYELSSFSGDKLAKVVCKRNSGDYPAMVSKIKTLEGETLQQKIYNYFKDGVNGTSISSEDLDWFICYMLGIDAEELGDIKNDVKPIVRAVSGNVRLFNALGQGVTTPGEGLNISEDGIKYIILNK